MVRLVLSTVLCAAYAAYAQVSTTSGSLSTPTTSTSSTRTSSTGVESSATNAPPPTSNSDTTVSTATPSVTGSLDQPLPSQAVLPPDQAWCPSEIFCAGRILQTINIAQPYADSKTIVDKPTNGTTQKVLTAFSNITSASSASGENVTYGEIVDFLNSNFDGEGLELQATPLNNFPTNPAGLRGVRDEVVGGFALAVHKIWNLLIRDTDESKVCTGGRCESSLIPLNHTFVVPGGRFREQYYWDSKFILDGLLVSELYSVANSTLQNFMDELEQFGFIPNGGRIYYLNRSQPPVFAGMVLSYYNATKDAATLARALPLIEKELKWWSDNRSVNVKSPFTNQTRTVYHYSVTNSAPRPESYLEDYETANGTPDAPLSTPYNDTQKAALYAELASGAETGWDYSTRWTREPYANEADTTNQNALLRTLNVRGTSAVDLNALIYKAHIDLANLYDMSQGGGGSNSKRGPRGIKRAPSDSAEEHRSKAAALKAAILDLNWDKDRLGFYDYNLTSSTRNTQWTAAHFYPLWAGIVPNEVQRDEQKAIGAFSSLNLIMRKYNGTIPATFIESGLQWDFPNAWPPHIFFALEALSNVPKNVSSATLPGLYNTSLDSYTLLPSNHLGLPSVDKLPLQLLEGNNTVGLSQDINALNGTVFNGGNRTATDSEGWAETLKREIANRYVTSVFCSWYATGGSLPNGLLPRLPNSTLALTHSEDQDGHLFEKFSALDVDSAGRGGEYAVQAGFGWTNGVLLWVVEKYKDVLVRPTCPAITAASTGQNAAENNAAMRMRLSAVAPLVLVLVGLVL